MKRLLALACLLLSLVNVAPALAQSGAPLLKAVEAGAKGRSVVLTWSRDGILATTLDGKFRLKVYDKPVESAALDGMADLLWFVADQKVQVLDLRAPAKEPRVVVAGFTATDFAIQGFGGAATTQARNRFLHVLSLVGSPSIIVRPPSDGSWDEAENQKALALAKSATVVGQDWLGAQVSRKVPPPPAPKGNRPPQPPTGGPADKVELSEQFRQCVDINACGRFMPFGQTGLRLVVAVQSCAGTCKKQCVLVDADNKPVFYPAPVIAKDAKPGDPLPAAESPTLPCGPYIFNTKNDAWIIDGRVCTRAGCQKVQGNLFAWLGGPNERTDLR